MWWTQAKKPLTYVKYQVDDTEVLVGPRLDGMGCDPDFFKSVHGWLVVTEGWVEYPISANVRWFPWKETTENFPDTVLFGSLHTLHHWIKQLKLPRIYIHCDLGTHRAPSTFGAFLRAFYSPVEATKIVDQREVYNNQALGYEDDQKRLNSHPLEYIDSKFEADPKLPYLVRAIVGSWEMDLDSILKYRLKEYLPDNLLNPEDLAERLEFHSNQDFFNEGKEKLKTLGYKFDDHHYGEFRAEAPNGTQVAVFMINPIYPYNPRNFVEMNLQQGRPVLVVAQQDHEIFEDARLDFTTDSQNMDLRWAFANLKS
jgi:hypothetical protein